MQLEHTFTVPVPVEVAWRALLDPERVAPCFPGATLTGVTDDEFTGNVKVRMGPVSLLYKGTGRFASVDEAAHRVVLEATGKDSRGNGTASATVTATLSPSGTPGPGPGPGAGDATAVDVHTDLTITGRPAQLGRGLVAEVGGKILDAFAKCLATQLAEPSDTPSPASPNGSPAGPAADQPTSATAATPASDAATKAAGSKPGSASQPLGAAAVDAKSGSAATKAAGSKAGSASQPAAAAPAPAPAPASTPRPVSSAEEIDLLQYAGQPVLKRLLPVLAGVLALLLVLRWLRRRG